MNRTMAVQIPASLLKILAEWIEKGKTGNVQVNFFKGGISTVNLSETVKLQPQ